MREFDHMGLLFAEYYGKLFEKSAELNCSSPIFFRRFLHSDLLKQQEKESAELMSLDVNEGMWYILNQYGDTSYGREKYSKSTLFWIGYMYGYISYTREHRMSFVMKLFKNQQMNSVYYTFHTQDPEWCIRSLLELNRLPEDEFDKNKRLKRIMLASGK